MRHKGRDLKKIINFDNQIVDNMRFKAAIIILLSTVSGFAALAQQLSNQVIVPLGAVVSGSNVSVSQTIGETAVELFSTPWYDLTQGFQQPLIKIMPGIKPLGNGVIVYPNPATENIFVEFFGDGKGAFTISVVNIVGTIVYTDKIYFNDDFWQVITIPASGFSEGLYFVRVISNDGVINRTFKIDKI